MHKKPSRKPPVLEKGPELINKISPRRIPESLEVHSSSSSSKNSSAAAPITTTNSKSANPITNSAASPGVSAAVATTAAQPASAPQPKQSQKSNLLQEVVALLQRPSVFEITSKKQSTQNAHISSEKLTSQQQQQPKNPGSIVVSEEDIPNYIQSCVEAALKHMQNSQQPQLKEAIVQLRNAEILIDTYMQQHDGKVSADLMLAVVLNLGVSFYKVGLFDEAYSCFENSDMRVKKRISEIKAKYKDAFMTAPSFQRPLLWLADTMSFVRLRLALNLQMCILFSEIGKHEDALDFAKKSAKLSVHLLLDTRSLALSLTQNQSPATNQQPSTTNKKLPQQPTLNFKSSFEEILSQIAEKATPDFTGESKEITKKWIGILKFVCCNFEMLRDGLSDKFATKNLLSTSIESSGILPQSTQQQRPAQENSTATSEELCQNSVDMHFVMSVVAQKDKHWLLSSNILSLLQMKPMGFAEIVALSTPQISTELSSDVILRKIVETAIGFYCISTETRFIEESQSLNNPKLTFSISNSEFWLGKSLEIAYALIPQDAPMLSQIINVYTRFHGIEKQIIPEDEQFPEQVKLLKPQKGVNITPMAITALRYNFFIPAIRTALPPSELKADQPKYTEADCDSVTTSPRTRTRGQPKLVSTLDQTAPAATSITSAAPATSVSGTTNNNNLKVGQQKEKQTSQKPTTTTTESNNNTNLNIYSDNDEDDHLNDEDESQNAIPVFERPIAPIQESLLNMDLTLDKQLKRPSTGNPQPEKQQHRPTSHNRNSSSTTSSDKPISRSSVDKHRANSSTTTASAASTTAHRLQSSTTTNTNHQQFPPTSSSALSSKRHSLPSNQEPLKDITTMNASSVSKYLQEKNLTTMQKPQTNDKQNVPQQLHQKTHSLSSALDPHSQTQSNNARYSISTTKETNNNNNEQQIFSKIEALVKKQRPQSSSLHQPQTNTSNNATTSSSNNNNNNNQSIPKKHSISTYSKPSQLQVAPQASNESTSSTNNLTNNNMNLSQNIRASLISNMDNNSNKVCLTEPSQSNSSAHKLSNPNSTKQSFLTQQQTQQQSQQQSHMFGGEIIATSKQVKKGSVNLKQQQQQQQQQFTASNGFTQFVVPSSATPASATTATSIAQPLITPSTTTNKNHTFLQSFNQLFQSQDTVTKPHSQEPRKSNSTSNNNNNFQLDPQQSSSSSALSNEFVIPPKRNALKQNFFEGTRQSLPEPSFHHPLPAAPSSSSVTSSASKQNSNHTTAAAISTTSIKAWQSSNTSINNNNNSSTNQPLRHSSEPQSAFNSNMFSHKPLQQFNDGLLFNNNNNTTDILLSNIANGAFSTGAAASSTNAQSGTTYANRSFSYENNKPTQTTAASHKTSGNDSNNPSAIATSATTQAAIKDLKMSFLKSHEQRMNSNQLAGLNTAPHASVQSALANRSDLLSQEQFLKQIEQVSKVKPGSLTKKRHHSQGRASTKQSLQHSNQFELPPEESSFAQNSNNNNNSSSFMRTSTGFSQSTRANSRHAHKRHMMMNNITFNQPNYSSNNINNVSTPSTAAAAGNGRSPNALHMQAQQTSLSNASAAAVAGITLPAGQQSQGLSVFTSPTNLLQKTQFPRNASLNNSSNINPQNPKFNSTMMNISSQIDKSRRDSNQQANLMQQQQQQQQQQPSSTSSQQASRKEALIGKQSSSSQQQQLNQQDQFEIMRKFMEVPPVRNTDSAQLRRRIKTEHDSSSSLQVSWTESDASRGKQNQQSSQQHRQYQQQQQQQQHGSIRLKTTML